MTTTNDSSVCQGVNTYEASIGSFLRGLAMLNGLLDKAQAHIDEGKITEADLLATRLYEDMFPLSRQIQSLSDAAKAGAMRLAGLENPSFPDTETTLAELRNRIASTEALLRGVDCQLMDDAINRTVTLRVRQGNMNFDGQQYLLEFALPNFYFHLVTAYDILRHLGVPIGKMDYLKAAAARWQPDEASAG